MSRVYATLPNVTPPCLMSAAPIPPVLSPVSDHFNAKVIKELIPDLYKEMHTNTALGAIFDAYAPNGIDTTKFGRIATVNYTNGGFYFHPRKPNVPVMFGRNVPVGTDLIVKVRVLRKVDNYVPEELYRVGVHLVDLNVKKCHMIKRYNDVSRLLTDFTSYTPGDDFRQYLLDSVQAFNGQQYIKDFMDERKAFYERFKVIGARF